MAGLRNTSRDSCDFALESERIWRDRELLTLHGDVNLDYAVDSVDFNIWLSNAFTFDTAWSQGNVNGDLAIDVRDFNVWNKYKFTPIVAPITSANGQGAMSAPLRRPRSAFAAANMENETSSVIAFAEEIASHPLSQWLEPLENHRSDQLFNEQYVAELPGQLALEAPSASAFGLQQVDQGRHFRRFDILPRVHDAVFGNFSEMNEEHLSDPRDQNFADFLDEVFAEDN